MNNVRFSLNLLRSLRTEAGRGGMTLAERAGLYAGARAVCDKFLEHIADHKGGNTYAREKTRGYLSHMGSALGFDTANGQPKSQHLSWALGELDSLGNVLTTTPEG